MMEAVIICTAVTPEQAALAKRALMEVLTQRRPPMTLLNYLTYPT